jgi:hypothetical protein
LPKIPLACAEIFYILRPVYGLFEKSQHFVMVGRVSKNQRTLSVDQNNEDSDPGNK